MKLREKGVTRIVEMAKEGGIRKEGERGERNGHFSPGCNCGSFIVRLLITADISRRHAIVNNGGEAGLSCRDHYLPWSITLHPGFPIAIVSEAGRGEGAQAAPEL